MNSSVDLLIQHTAFSAHKTLHLLEGLGVKDVFFFFNLALRQEDKTPPLSNLAMRQTFHFFVFDFLGTESEKCLSYFLSLGRGKKTGRRGKEEELEGVKATELNAKRRWIKECTQKKMRDDTKGSTVAPFITAFISFLSLRGEVTECVYVHCSY